jgi:hypothetical protein
MMVTVARQGTGSWRDNGPWTACGITTLVAVDGKWKAVQVNDATHLGRAVTLEEQ